MSAEKQANNTSQEMERLAIEVGNPEFEPGFTRVRLGADGQVQIETRLYKEVNRYEYKMEPKEAAALIEKCLEPQLAAKAGFPRPGLPDEPRYHIEVYRGKERLQNLEVWRSDLPEMGELGAVIGILGQGVEQVSDGQALL